MNGKPSPPNGATTVVAADDTTTRGSASGRFFTFLGGDAGPWRIERVDAVVGASLPRTPRVDLINGLIEAAPLGARWALRGATSYERYVTRDERTQLVRTQPGLGRPEATCAALIPIRKSEAWWALTQDERRAIFERDSQHIHTGLAFLPAVARRLHHSRDLGEPFDFLTWFEYAPGEAPAFEQLVSTLRASAEWTYVEREVDIRLVRESVG